MKTQHQLIPTQETTIYLFEDIVYLRFDMKPVTGTIYEDFENGQRKLIIEYKDGKLNGPCKEWYDNGFLKYYYNYKEGIRNGEFKRWNEDGRLFSKETFIDGKLEGYRYLNFTESFGSNDEFSKFDRKMLDEIFIEYSDEIFEEGYEGGNLKFQNRFVLNPDYEIDSSEEGYTCVHGSRQVYGIIDVDIEYDGEKEIYNETYGLSEEYTGYIVRPIEFLKFRNGEPHGRQTYWALENPYSEYNCNFYLFKEENYLNGKKHGNQIINFRNGKKKSEENYVNGLKEGKQYKWNDEGLLICEENFENGEKDGEQKYWNSFGSLTNQNNYKEGKLHGNQTKFDYETRCDRNFESYWDESYLSEESFYEEGVIAERRHYNKYGLISVDYFHNGLLDGVCRSYNEENQLSCETTYHEGKLNGLRRRWYENGQLKFEQNYKENKADGLIMGWYNSGRKFYEWFYKEGVPDGFFRFWYDDGQLMVEGEYFEGKLKSIKYLDNQGNETKNFQMPFLLSIEEAPYLMFPDRNPEE